MTLRLRTFALLVSISAITYLCPLETVAQIDVTYPVNRMVIQRSNDNQATVQIAGSYAQPLDAVEARMVARVASQGTSTNWATLQANPTNGQFNGTVVTRGGWYRIEVRGMRNGQVVATDSVSRFGVGEVFAIMGHSNAQGSSCVINGVDKCPTMEGAADDRVTVVGLVTGTPEFYQYELTADTKYIPGLAFSQLMTFSGISPFAKVSWFWGRMGDLLVQRINVPVLIYNAGFGGTNMEHNYKAAYDIPFEHGFVNYSIRMPFVNTRNIMNLYVPSTGIRAMLLNHGENDRGNPTDQILMHHYGVIDKVKQEFNKPDLAWIIALSSFVSGPFDNVRSAQYQVARNPNYRTYPGPDLDNITALDDRPDGIHYSPSGQAKAAERWANAITNEYLQSITPYMAQTQPLASIACTNNNQLQLTQPDGYAYNWNTGSTNRNLTVGAGTYSARIRNGQNQQFFPPAITVPATVRPATPTLTTAGGALEICRSTGLTLTSSNPDLNKWSTGATTPSITVTSPGTYTLQAQNAVYGCLSDAVSKTISLAGADLSLSMRVSRRTPVVGDTITFTLMVRNESSCDAGAVTMRNRLPDNLTFVSSADGLAVANGIVSGTVAAVPAGGLVSRRYVARLTASAVYQNAAELAVATNPDPDSQPGSGTGDGQDDAAMADLRTKGTGTPGFYVSPNPNQTPLPPVQDNQPDPTPDKADLSLTMLSDQRTLRIGQVVTFTLTVSNVGSLPATNVGVRNSLPAGLQFISGSGMNATGQIVSGSILLLAPGSRTTLTFTARATASGSVTNEAQISASDQPDPDSTVNNGTDKGEDDEAQTDLRILTP
ncbi:DUF11 domain-containing protein [Spirosoma utsteinense]|uniref:Repeat protein (TIGR01451 family) n=1 Tax=Spirosoma utsteinense TaxID=2585773 RepID=A0ABR6WBH5_9BACT|nr:DUF11 domain-containing protein [Spirosoma utsteinense]MBC3786755.1 putative repeat protein (TIGR01451 family) [Spirosoma utsteinense]MBC3793302.1 putative repeat protein (TIGR01451 family) [Spirosoma utsteinense]